MLDSVSSIEEHMLPEDGAVMSPVPEYEPEAQRSSMAGTFTINPYQLETTEDEMITEAYLSDTDAYVQA